MCLLEQIPVCNQSYTRNVYVIIYTQCSSGRER